MVSASQGYACECPCEVSAQIGSKRASAGGFGRRRGWLAPGPCQEPATRKASPEAAMDALLKEGQRLGLEPGTISHVLLGGLEEGDEGWLISHEKGVSRASQEAARNDLKVGVPTQPCRLEYHCRHYDGSAQGTAVFKAEAWESKEKCVLSGRHELITDEYYDWYVNHDCTHGTLLHFCSGRVGQCRTRLEPGDQRELVHVGKWRQLTPALCLRQAYTQKLGVEMGLEALKKAAADAFLETR